MAKDLSLEILSDTPTNLPTLSAAAAASWTELAVPGVDITSV